jgi:hypothetical protein
MNSSNLAIVFAPNLVRSPKETMQQVMLHTPILNSVTRTIIDNINKLLPALQTTDSDMKRLSKSDPGLLVPSSSSTVLHHSAPTTPTSSAVDSSPTQSDPGNTTQTPSTNSTATDIQSVPTATTDH